MSTVKFYLKDPHSKSKTLIYLFFSFKGKRLKCSTGESIRPKDWNDTSHKSRSDSDLNDFLKSFGNTVTEIERQMRTNKENVTPDILRQKLKEAFNDEKKIKHNFITFIEEYIKSVEDTKKISTIKSYRNTLRHLREYSFKPIEFENITLEFYNNFIKHLKVVKMFSVNTIGKQIKNIKFFLNEATESGINKTMDFKLRKFKGMAEDADSIYLNLIEIDQLYKLPLAHCKRLEQVRDLFIVGCYTGLRFSDFSQIKPEHIKDGAIHIRTQKTDEPVVIPIHPMVGEIMVKYKDQYSNSMPNALSNQKMNKYLKEVAELALLNERVILSKNKGSSRVDTTFYKYELVTTHTARRSMATNLFLGGVPPITIMQITGHKTEKAFLKYVKATPLQHAYKIKEHWEQSTNSKI